MNKTELINTISEKTNATKKDTGLFLDTFIETVETTLANGEKVQLVGFGSFETITRAARKGINPQTKEEILIAAKKAPKFKVGKEFKNIVNK